jgi:hypothetical protein
MLIDAASKNTFPIPPIQIAKVPTNEASKRPIYQVSKYSGRLRLLSTYFGSSVTYITLFGLLSGVLVSGPINPLSHEELVMNSFLLPQNRRVFLHACFYLTKITTLRAFVTIRGLIHHVSARTPEGDWRADQILRDYQRQTDEIRFRRWPLRNVCTVFLLLAD